MDNAPVSVETTITDLQVRGELPAALSGHYLQIGPNRILGMVHAVSIDAAAVSYRNRRLTTDAVAATRLIAFGRSILALSDGALAYELSPQLDTVRRVDLAGGRRGLVAHSMVDSRNGELHLLTSAFPSQMHVAVSAGGLTRTIRSIDDAPSRIRQLELTGDDVVLVADGFVGVTARAGVNTNAIWFETDTEERQVAGAYAHGETVIVYAIGPSLERWTLDRRARTAHAEVLDATPHSFATSNPRQPGPAHRFLWTLGAGAAHKHDLVSGEHRSHPFGDRRTPGAFVFVADPDRSGTEDGGWLVGSVQDDARNQAELIVVDAQAIERPAVATVPIPRPIPTGAHGTWISAP